MKCFHPQTEVTSSAFTDKAVKGLNFTFFDSYNYA